MHSLTHFCFDAPTYVGTYFLCYNKSSTSFLVKKLFNFRILVANPPREFESRFDFFSGTLFYCWVCFILIWIISFRRQKNAPTNCTSLIKITETTTQKQIILNKLIHTHCTRNWIEWTSCFSSRYSAFRQKKVFIWKKC